MPIPSYLAEQLDSTARAVTLVVFHTIVVAVIIVCAFLIEKLILGLWAGHEPAIYGVHMSEIVLTADIGLLFAFLATASIKAAHGRIYSNSSAFSQVCRSGFCRITE